MLVAAVVFVLLLVSGLMVSYPSTWNTRLAEYKLTMTK